MTQVQHVDHVARMEEWRKRHPDATWTRPEVGSGGDHVVTYVLNGHPDKAAHNDLGRLMDYLEAVDKATMAIPDPPRIAAK